MRVFPLILSCLNLLLCTRSKTAMRCLNKEMYAAVALFTSLYLQHEMRMKGLKLLTRTGWLVHGAQLYDPLTCHVNISSALPLVQRLAVRIPISFQDLGLFGRHAPQRKLVIPDCLQELRVTNCRRLKGIVLPNSACNNSTLRDVRLYNCTKKLNLSFLGTCPDLYRLSIRYDNTRGTISDTLEWLALCQSLSVLTLCDHPSIHSLNVLTECRALRLLEVEELDCLESLPKMPFLTQLTVIHCRELRAYEFLRDCHSLKCISLNGPASGWEDIRGHMQHLGKLTRLSLEQCDILDIPCIPSLAFLRLVDCVRLSGYANVEHLKNMTGFQMDKDTEQHRAISDSLVRIVTANAKRSQPM
jgi:hypothetical protein